MLRPCNAAALTILIVVVGLGLLGLPPAQAQSPVSEVRDSGGNTLMTVFDNGRLEVTGGFLLPDGTLLDDSTDLSSLSLPFSGTASASDPLLELIQDGSGEAGFFDVANSSSSADALTATTIGTGRAGEFKIFNTDNNTNALFAQTDGDGSAVKGLQTGAGPAGVFEVDNSSNGATALEVSTSGKGGGGQFQITNSSNLRNALTVSTAGDGDAIQATAGAGHAGNFQAGSGNSTSALFAGHGGSGTAVSGVNTGTGSAGAFEIANANNAATALSVESNAEGEDIFRPPALAVLHTGFGRAGNFVIDNSSSGSFALRARTTGTGPAGNFRIDNFDSDAAALEATTQGTGFVADLIASQSGTGARDNPAGNLARIANFAGQGADVLALQAGPSNPSSGVNYLSFYDDQGTSVGAVEGNGSGGVRYKTSGSDYAEMLPVVEGRSKPEPADLVGVQGGAVSLNTKKVHHLMVVTGQAAVLGNASAYDTEEAPQRVPVAFVGQVPVKVRGQANVGDVIVASGRSDGTAQAISPDDYRPVVHGPIAGQAWASKSTDGLGRITVAVGLHQSGAVTRQLREHHAQIGDQQRRFDRQQSQIDSLRRRTRRIDQIQNRLAALESQGRPATAGWAGGPAGLVLAVLLGGLLGAGLLHLRQR